MSRSLETLAKTHIRPYRPIVELTLPAEPEAVSRARQLLGAPVEQKARKRGPFRRRFTAHEQRILTGRKDDLQLVISELTTNAVQHGSPENTQQAETGPQNIVVGVGKERRHFRREAGIVLFARDNTPDFGEAADGDVMGESGRGELITGALADATGHFKRHSARGLRRIAALFSPPDQKEVYSIFRQEKSPVGNVA